jgi:hypothetical protein
LQAFSCYTAERKHVRRRGDFNNIETRAVIKFFHAVLTETLGEHVPSYVTVKNWVIPFKRGDFSSCDAARPGQHKTVTTPAITDQI